MIPVRLLISPLEEGRKETDRDGKKSEPYLNEGNPQTGFEYSKLFRDPIASDWYVSNRTMYYRMLIPWT